MHEMVRVKAENGSEVTVTKAFAAKHGLPELDKQATDSRGYALSEKPKLTLPKSGSKYDAMKPEELKDEADARQLPVEGTGKDGNVLKADLIAALVAHDAGA